MQAAVRSRLQRLKLDLQKAQAKLQTVDQVRRSSCYWWALRCG